MSIYFLVSDDSDGMVLKRAVVKIGYSDGNTARRVYDVGTGCPFSLKLHAKLPGGKKREKAIQDRFAAHRIRKEWFWWTEEIVAWLATQEQEPPTVEEIEAFYRNRLLQQGLPLPTEDTGRAA